MNLLFKCINCNSVLRKFVDTSQTPPDKWIEVKTSCPQCNSDLVYFVSDEKPIRFTIKENQVFYYHFYLGNKVHDFHYKILNRVMDKENIEKTLFYNTNRLFDFYHENVNKKIIFDFHNQNYVQVPGEGYLIPKWSEDLLEEVRRGYYLLRDVKNKFDYAYMEVTLMFINTSTGIENRRFVTIPEICEVILISPEEMLFILQLLCKYRYVGQVDNKSWVRVSDDPRKLEMLSKILYQAPCFYFK